LFICSRRLIVIEDGDFDLHITDIGQLINYFTD
jgi:hypothetical protein